MKGGSRRRKGHEGWKVVEEQSGGSRDGGNHASSSDRRDEARADEDWARRHGKTSRRDYGRLASRARRGITPTVDQPP